MKLFFRLLLLLYLLFFFSPSLKAIGYDLEAEQQIAVSEDSFSVDGGLRSMAGERHVNIAIDPLNSLLNATVGEGYAKMGIMVALNLDPAGIGKGVTKMGLANVPSNINPVKNRVKLRTNVKKEIFSNAPTNAQGQYIDPNTKQAISGKPDIGHIQGQSRQTRKQMHTNQGSTRKEVLDTENNASLYQLEDPSSNRSHRYE